MKRMLRRISAVFLAALLLCCTSAPAIWADASARPAVREETVTSRSAPPSPALGTLLKRCFYNSLDRIIDVLLKGLLRRLPDVGWVEKEAYQTDHFYEGDPVFLDQPAEGARWRLGYANASLLTGSETDGRHYHAGGFSLPAKPVTAVLDDQAVRAVCLSDGSGRGIKAFVSIDCYGISLTDVREIRARLAGFAQEHGIDAVNISAVHQHSCVDTLGLGGDLVKMLVGNALRTKYLPGQPVYNGKNPAFMENLFSVTAETVQKAAAAMQPGRLYASFTDISDYLRDKREPLVFDPSLVRLRFAPDSGGRETWIVNGAVHPVSFGTTSTEISADFPYYMEQTVNERANADFLYFQGAELGITAQRELTDTEGMTSLASAKAYGARLGELLCSVRAEEEQEVAPLLNLRMREIAIPVDNQVLVLAAKAQSVNNIAVKTAQGIEIVTELGYLELGNELCVVTVPGEIAPELVTGGCLPAELAWRNTNWTLPPIADAAPGRRMLVLGLTNDQVGYILPDNDVRSILSGSNEEIVSLGGRAGSTVVMGLQELIGSVKHEDMAFVSPFI